MYKLTLTHGERKAIDFVGNRYSCGDNLSWILWSCPNDAVKEWGEKNDITFEIPEGKAWEIKELIENDLEGTTFPLFNEELSQKLITFYDSII